MISIIIPAYNCENYIEKCIRSVIEQEYSEWELIIVNDGSIDNTESICLLFKEMDNRIRYMRQENGGPGKARNNGLRCTSGEYIMFMDADDFLEPNILGDLMEQVVKSKADLCVFGIKMLEGNDEKLIIPSKSERTINISEYVQGILIDDKKYGGGFTVAKVWKTEVIKKNDFVQYDEQLGAYEDKIWIIENMERISKICLFPKIIYNYMVRKESLSHKVTKKKIRDTALAYKKLLEVGKSYYTKEIMCFLENKYYLYLMHYIYTIYGKAEEKLIQEFKNNYQRILFCSENKVKTKIKTVFVRILVGVEEIRSKK